MCFAVTVRPLVVKSAFQEPTMVWPAGRARVTVQPLRADEPVLVTVTGSMTYPSPHWVWRLPVAVQGPLGPPPPSSVVKVTVLDASGRLPAPSRARTYTVYWVSADSPVRVIELVDDWPSSGSVAPCSR